MVRKTLIKQMLLCFALGPIGLAIESVQYAITATLFSLALMLAFTSYALWIWLAGTVLSAATGALLIRARFKREEIDNYQLSTFVGTVSCRVIAKGSVDRSYKKLLKKLKFRRKLGYGIDLALGVVCVLLVITITAPGYVSGLFLSDTATDDANALKAETKPAESYQTSPLLSTDSEGTYTVRSTNILLGRSGPYRATLELGCLNNSTTLSITSTDILGTERSAVTISLNDDRSQKTTWYIHDDFHSATSPKPIEMLKKMKHQSEVVFQFQPFDSSEINKAQFDGEMINTAIKGIQKVCRW